MLVELETAPLEDLIQAALNQVVAIQSGPLSSAEYASVADRLTQAAWALQAARVAPPAVDPGV